jgi:hypothetical protein
MCTHWLTIRQLDGQKCDNNSHETMLYTNTIDSGLTYNTISPVPIPSWFTSTGAHRIRSHSAWTADVFGAPNLANPIAFICGEKGAHPPLRKMNTDYDAHTLQNKPPSSPLGDGENLSVQCGAPSTPHALSTTYKLRTALGLK